MAEEEAQLTLDVLLKRSVRRPLLKTRGPFSLLLVALCLVSGSKGMRIRKIRHVMVFVAVVVGTPVATRTTSITVEIGVVFDTRQH